MASGSSARGGNDGLVGELGVSGRRRSAVGAGGTTGGRMCDSDVIREGFTVVRHLGVVQQGMQIGSDLVVEDVPRGAVNRSRWRRRWTTKEDGCGRSDKSPLHRSRRRRRMTE